MTRSMLATATLAAFVALAGCSSDDDDDTDDTSGTDSEETSELGEDRLLSSEPGGDTRAVAGYWDASRTGDEAVADERFVVIAENGLWTEYLLGQDDVTGGNCYRQVGPQTLTPAEDDRYDLDEGTSVIATRGDDESTLTVEFEPDLVQTWTLVEGRDPMDLPICDDSEEELEPAGENVLPGEEVEPGPGESTFNPDLEPAPPSTDPSGNDTAAIAGLWDATGGPEGRVDVRYVEISGDGLWTEHDFREDDLGGEGNCYLSSSLRLDLELGDAASGEYSIGDGRSFVVDDAGGDGTLDLTFLAIDSDDGGDDGEESVSWSRVEDAIDFQPCDGE